MIIIDSNKLENTPAEDRSHAPLLASVWLRLVLHPILMLWNLCQSQYLWPNTAAVLLLTWGYENLTPVAFKKKIFLVLGFTYPQKLITMTIQQLTQHKKINLAFHKKN